MSADSSEITKENVPIEEAINRAGFGLYSYTLTAFAGVAIIAFACIGYGSTILVPTSACELETTASQQGLLAAAPVVGSIVGTLIWGYLADTRGRRKMLMLSLLGGGILNSLASLSVNWIMMMILQFVAATFVAGLHSMSMSILSESVPMTKRNTVVLLVTSIFLLAQGLMAVVAIPIIPLPFSLHMPALGIYWNSWRTLMLVYSMPAFGSAIWIFFMKESPKFFYTKGHDDNALETLRTIHRINHLRSDNKYTVSSLLREESDTQSAEKSQISMMFKRPLLKYTIIMSLLLMFQQVGAFIVWLPTIADQFVRILETGEGSDQALCGIISSGIDAPTDPDAVPCALNVTSLLIVLGVGVAQSLVNFLMSFIVNKAGRRNLVIVITLVCGASGIVVNLVPNAIGSVVFFGIMLMGIIVLGMYTAIIVALFPTQLRAIALALPLTFGRLAVVASIQILNLLLINNCDIGFYLFSALFASSAIVAMFLPDDRYIKKAPVEVIEPKIIESPRSPTDLYATNDTAETGSFVYRKSE